MRIRPPRLQHRIRGDNLDFTSRGDSQMEFSRAVRVKSTPARGIGLNEYMADARRLTFVTQNQR
jgi:hypothetical protein